MTLKSLILVPFIAKGKNCTACIGAYTLLLLFLVLQVALKISQEAFLQP